MNKCKRHNGETVTKWCENHEEAACDSCFRTYHQECKNHLDINDVKIKEDELKETTEQIHKTCNDLDVWKKSRIDAQQTSIKETERALKVIKDFEDNLDSMKRELGKKARAAVEAKYEDVQETVQNDLTAIEDVLTAMEETAKSLQQVTFDDAAKFILIKQAEQEIVAAKMVSMEISRAPSSQRIVYVVEPNHLVAAFGKVYQQLYAAKNKREINIKASGETKCNINDCCLLPDGSILLVDASNNKLKRLTSHKVTDFCTVPASPIAVCRTGLQEAAVSLADNSIQLVVMTPRLTRTRLLKMTHPCWGLTYRGGQLFVSDNDERIVVYKTDGAYQRTISKGADGKSLFKNASHLAAHNHRDEIYVADHGTGVVCIDSNGKQLYSFSNDQLKGVRGICSDNADGLFVSGIRSNKVLQLGKGGTLLGVIADEGKGVKHPRSLLYNPQKNQLFVTRDVQDSILELELA